MRVLVACEFSGVVRDAFIARGHDAVSCDILPSERPGPHIQGDVRAVLSDGWDMMIAHPPCTCLCNSGVRWLHTRPERWAELEAAAAFFLQLWNAPIDRVAIENPKMHHYGRQLIGIRPRQAIQPWQFGHSESKETQLWMRGLRLLWPTCVLGERRDNLTATGERREGPSADRWAIRSRTYTGIAAAMAEQWG